MTNTQLEELLAGQPEDDPGRDHPHQHRCTAHRPSGGAARSDPRRPHRAVQLVPHDAVALRRRQWPSSTVSATTATPTPAVAAANVHWPPAEPGPRATRRRSRAAGRRPPRSRRSVRWRRSPGPASEPRGRSPAARWPRGLGRYPPVPEGPHCAAGARGAGHGLRGSRQRRAPTTSPPRPPQRARPPWPRATSRRRPR